MFKQGVFKKVLCFIVAASLISLAVFSDLLKIKDANAAEITLPAIGTLVELSDAFSLASIKGIKFDQDNPFELQFIMDRGDQDRISDKEKSKLVRLFLAALTVPEENLWVNLSPYEKERVIDENVAKTEIGEILLGQDYILKQLSSSLTNPDTELGKQYWSMLDGYKKDVINKVWITPSKISIYDDLNVVFINDIKLEVQTEADYLAAQENELNIKELGSNAVRDLIVPEIEEDVNYGRNFAELRQMINSVVLAQCFKRKFANSLYSFYYDAQKLDGLDLADANLKVNVFKRYVDAFNVGAYNVVKKERDPSTGRVLKRSYFSGGIHAKVEEEIVEKISIDELNGSMVYEVNSAQTSLKKEDETSSSMSLEQIGEQKLIAINSIETLNYSKFEPAVMRLVDVLLAEESGFQQKKQASLALAELPEISQEFKVKITPVLIDEIVASSAMEEADGMWEGNYGGGDSLFGPVMFWLLTISSILYFMIYKSDLKSEYKYLESDLRPRSVELINSYGTEDFESKLEEILPELRDVSETYTFLGYKKIGAFADSVINVLDTKGAIDKTDYESQSWLKSLETSESPTNGGIDLKNMLDGIEVEISTAAIAISPKNAAQITGIRFKFVGDSKVLPLNMIINSPQF